MKKKLNEYFDHTLLRPDAQSREIIRLCEEAVKYDFYAVCVNPSYVSLAAKHLVNTSIKVAAVAGFPLGVSTANTKAFEADQACNDGASEIDMVLNTGAMKDKRYKFVTDDIATVTGIAAEYDAKVKVILETCLLTDEEIIDACGLATDAGADFVKTSTGFGSKGATTHHVKLMRASLPEHMKVKAAGGIRNLKTALEMIEAGADRLGVSASIDIMNEYISSSK